MVLTGSNAWALTEAGGVLAGRRGRIQKQPAARSHRDGASRKAMEEHCDPSQPDIHREDVGISNQVVTRHADYLRDAFLLRACPQRLDSTVLTEMQIGMAARRRMLVDRPPRATTTSCSTRAHLPENRSTTFPPTSGTWRAKASTPIGVYGKAKTPPSARRNGPGSLSQKTYSTWPTRTPRGRYRQEFSPTS